MYDSSLPTPPVVEGQKQSKIGIASFVVSLIALLIFCAGFIVSFGYGFSVAMKNPLNPQVDQSSSIVLITGAVLCLSLVAAVAGLILGIVSVVQKTEKKTFGIIGLVIGALITTVYCLLFVFGIVLQLRGGTLGL